VRPFSRIKDPAVAGFIASTCRGVAMVAGIFSVAVATLLVANYVQMVTMKPLDSPAMADLRALYKAKPDDDQLAAEIRALDLVSRRAYFTRQWQTTTGGWMLVAGVALFLGCLHASTALRDHIPVHKPAATREAGMKPRQTRVALSVVGVLVLGGGLAAGTLASRLIGPGTPVATPASAPAVASPAAPNWPQFRGPGGNGIAAVTNAPTDWDGKSGKNIRWSASIPLPGRCSPVVWGSRVYLSGADDSSREVYCWDTASGNLIWRTSVPLAAGAPAWPPRVDKQTGYAASTMAVNATAAFVIFANGDVTALSTQDKGKVLWSRHIGSPNKNYGYASSLGIWEDTLIVQFDQEDAGLLYALRTDTGKDIWVTPREVTSSWSSPVIVATGTRMEVLVNGNPFLASYDLATGKELWRSEATMVGENAASPAFADGRVIGANQMLELVAMDPRNNGATIWSAPNLIADPSSPLTTAGLVLVATSDGYVVCLDAAKGDELWSDQDAKGFYASPIFAAGRFYLLDRTGVMRIFAADKTMKLLASPASPFAAGESIEATPAFTEGTIFIRSATQLFCIGDGGAGK
jgi:outer membrane protein assembly factor BamB